MTRKRAIGEAMKNKLGTDTPSFKRYGKPAQDQYIILDLQATIDRLAKGLVKISEMCPYDKDFNQLDEHPINQIRGTIAEVGDTARALIAEIEGHNKYARDE